AGQHAVEGAVEVHDVSFVVDDEPAVDHRVRHGLELGDEGHERGMGLRHGQIVARKKRGLKYDALTQPQGICKLKATLMSTALMDKRHGPSISVKMILTTTALIVMIVVGFGLLNVWTIGRVFDESVSDKERLIRQQLGRLGQASVTAIASSSRSYLEGSN